MTLPRSQLTRLPLNAGRSLREDSGATLVELIAALGIAVLVLAFVGVAVVQFFRLTNWGNDRMVLTSNLQTAQVWLGRDVVQASSFTAGSAPVYGVFTLPAVSGPARHVSYSFDFSDHTLVRTDVESSQSQVVARDIASQSDVSFTRSGQMLTVNLTVTRGGQSDTHDLMLYMRVP